MDRRRAAAIALVAALLLAAAALVASSGLLAALQGPPPDSGYERTTVAVHDGNGTRLGSVEVRVADTDRKRYTGLSNTSRLPPGEGMLFVHDGPGERTYVMRGMEFGIDIVFAAPDGTITAVHSAPEPPEGADGSDYRYSGEGQYVLEVNYGWTAERGVSTGDCLVIDGYETDCRK
ncbi:DUF192 domain-containing protein [Halobacteriales archaeon QS_5_70_17]|jgi:uncharacterized membrane protein (UPF0127 family)|nr:MAG: DUF192 domain-containing protein [Halobacteriales archaeon QS_5_70_17]